MNATSQRRMNRPIQSLGRRVQSGFAGIVVLAWLAAGQGQDARVAVSDFAGSGLTEWKERSFKGHSEYHLAEDNGTNVIVAQSRSTASGLYREIKVDLRHTPYLNWSWRVDRPLPPTNERTRSGDDFAARLYVVKDGGIAFWRTRAVNYVWSGSQPEGSEWPNPFTDRAMMHAQRGANDSGWKREKRNVREDLLRLFGEEIDQIDAVAIMSDTDNTGGEADAWYGEIWFSER